MISNTFFINSFFFFLVEWSLVEKQPFQILEIQRTKHITQTDCPNRLRKQTAQEDLTATQTDSPNRVPKQIAQSEYQNRIFQKIYQ